MSDKDRIVELETALKKAEGNYQFMVDRAADQHLGGYRELGAKVAAAENALDEARADAQRYREALEGLHRAAQFTSTAAIFVANRSEADGKVEAQSRAGFIYDFAGHVYRECSMALAAQPPAGEQQGVSAIAEQAGGE